MGNRDIISARDYHERTKHSPVSIRSGPHYLDWDNQPHPFKVYENLDSLPLEEHLVSSDMPALRALSAPAPEGEREITRQELGELLFLCAGVTRRRRYFGGEMLFRAAACTGALYHIDIYVVTGALADLDAGVYHFAPDRFALTPLRTGDHRGVLVEAGGAEDALAHAPAILVLASTFWRNSWKYRDRAYRHCFWDGGTILANGLAAAAAREYPGPHGDGVRRRPGQPPAGSRRRQGGGPVPRAPGPLGGGHAARRPGVAAARSGHPAAVRPRGGLPADPGDARGVESGGRRGGPPLAGRGPGGGGVIRSGRDERPRDRGPRASPGGRGRGVPAGRQPGTGDRAPGLDPALLARGHHLRPVVQRVALRHPRRRPGRRPRRLAAAQPALPHRQQRGRGRPRRLRPGPRPGVVCSS